MTEQEAFDRVWTWFISRQNGLSVGQHKGILICKYRGLKGSRCSIGVLIDDNVYKRKMERKEIKELTKEYPSLFGGLSKKFLHALQSCHDMSVFSGGLNRTRHPVAEFHLRMKNKLRKVAKSFRLKVPPKKN